MKTKLGKKSDSPIFKQILDLIPYAVLRAAINKYKSDKSCSKYFTKDQLISTLFGQLNKCQSLRDIAMGIDQSPEFLADIGLEQSPAKSTMSDGNAKRDYRVFEELYYLLLKHYKCQLSMRPDYKVIQEIEGMHIKIIDATLMSVCLKLFQWAEYRTAKGGIKAHVSLDEASMIPDIVNISEAKVSDRRGADNFRYEKDTIIVDDRGYFDVKLFKIRIGDGNYFVTRIKDNILYESVREYDLPEDKDTHILKDEIIRLTGKSATENGMDKVELRRIAVYIEDGNRTVELICNNLEWSAATIAELYKRRWLIETFFKLIKQNLQIKTFLGTTPNACKSQIFIALIGYLLLELIRRTLCKTPHRFGHFVTLIRVCLTQYNRLGYVVNNVQIKVRAARKRQNSPADLFSNQQPEKDFEQLLIEFG
ncbi:MAG: IS4 family transposase [Bacteroidales bacterium]